ncbi:hypothetical protein [Massilia arenae]|uniref:Uncharacterized protein n=1 Tax=Massilia arenae TaxID=2603288 RepID=A0A5C7FSB1_9BURK|nr:hypothetical protein [Massilia arenae]TXF98962.1 hypothetical protein FVD38_14260 [Massilia arenae]
MSTPDNSDRKQEAPVPAGGQDNRSDNLLPGEEGAEDGRFDVAEEVNLDQQSDEARRIGQAPSQGIADAIPEALRTPVPSQQVPDKS